jgi:hypothetical protein
MTTGYKIRFPNLGYAPDASYTSLGEAQRAARLFGFESVIELGGQPVATFSPISGFRVF